MPPFYIRSQITGLTTATNKLYSLFDRLFIAEWLFAFVLVILARLPYLLSDHVYFDGDEAMLGIMGRDLISGRNIPVYFYGQRYGFSFFEVLSVGLFIPFFGSSLASLKLGGMLLFSLGVQRYMHIMRMSRLKVLPYLLITVIICLFPTWQVWATKLRGGYITAFVAMAFIMEQVLLHSHWKKKNLSIVSLLSALIVVCQPLFLLVAIPIILFRIYRLPPKNLFGAIGLFTVTLTILRIPVFLNQNVWKPVGFGEFNLDGVKFYLTEGFLSSFTGFFAFSDIYEVPPMVKVGALLTCIGLFFMLGSMLLRSERKTQLELLLIVFGTCLSLAPIAFLGIGGSRYLLPFFTGWLIVLILILIRLSQTRVISVNLILALVVIATSLTTTGYNRYVSFWLEPELNDMRVLNELKSELKKRNINHAFVSEWQVFWQLNYLGNEEMNFRYLGSEDRVQRFVDEVNDCYLNENCPIALIGSLWPLHDMQNVIGWNDRIERINDRFYLMEAPEKIFLETGGFELPEAN